MVAVYWVLAVRGVAGINVAVSPLTLTVPVLTVPPVVVNKVKLTVFSVEFVIASEKVAETEALVATPIAALAGDVVDTVGGVVSESAPVVKLQMKLAASGFLARSLAAVVIVAVYCVAEARLAEGTSIAVLPLLTTAPLTAAPPAVGLRVKLDMFSVALVIASEKVADTEEFGATPVAALSGDVSETIGGVVSASARWRTRALSSGACSPPPPQPTRPRLANSIAETMPVEIRTVILLPFDMREALKINVRNY
jgi:hypothetical protein